MKKVLLILFYAVGLTVYSQVPTDNDLNWVTSETFDVLGNTKAKNKSYFNDLGKQIQAQSLDIKTNRIWATQIIYDYQGRPAFQSVSAPIRDNASFSYEQFVLKIDSNPLTTSDIEQITETSSLPNMSTQNNKLGWFYSENNNREPYQDITDNPYSKVIYSKLFPGNVLKNIGGNKIDTNNDGTPDKFLQTYSFTMLAPQELASQFAFNDVKYESIKTIKTVIRDVNEVETVVFTDGDGNTLAAARSGDEESSANTPYEIFLTIKEQGYVDIHIPKGCEDGINTAMIINQGTHLLNYYNLITEESSLIKADIINGSGFYRIAIKDFNIDNYDLYNPIIVQHNVNYYDYSLNTYDKLGRLRVSKQPLGLISVYNYNSLGQLTNTTSQDEGTAHFLYRLDGQIRFSQNSKQQIANEFSYTNYDKLGRPIESGVGTGDFLVLDPDNVVILGTNFKEQHYTTYDIANASLQSILTSYGLPLADYKQTFLYGNVSKTYTENPITNTTYYSYDEYGRVRWLIQNIQDLGVKTIDYEYDSITGVITRVIYQKHNKDEVFIHRYTYNSINQLIKVETSVDNKNFKEQVKYFYYETGVLKRTEIAENLQGVDYIYNINGQLKAINSPSITAAFDPGQDGQLGSNFNKDVFGLALDYYNGDYTRINTPTPIKTTPQGIDQFNGNIKATRWQTETMSTVQNAYSYQYNKNNWLTSANFGTVNNTNANIIFNANNDYGVSDLGYDQNGNILSLNRNGHNNGGTNAMDNFEYYYKSGKNQLDYVKDTNDNSDVNRYDDLKNQNINNYNYNSIGQLGSNNQDGITYKYNASGLVTGISKYSNNNENFIVIYNQDFESATVYETEPWTVDSGNINVNYNNSCNDIKDNFGQLLEVNYTGGSNYLVKRDFTTLPDKNYKLKFDAFIKPENIAIFEIDFVIKAKGEIIATNTILSNNLSQISGCDYFQLNQLLEFTSLNEFMTLEIKFTVDPHNTNVQLLLDNIELSVATEPLVSFYYDDRGQRIRKETYTQNGLDKSFYVRDVSGSVMAIYSGNDNSLVPERVLAEQPIYGIDRLGVLYRSQMLSSPSWDGYNYELTDHLGNVRAIITKTITSSAADVQGSTDYYPFGVPMPDRNIQDANNYRYAYQGQEKDPETGKEAFELRLWDGRIGRWLTTDPARQFASPYLGIGNDPINFIDRRGDIIVRGKLTDSQWKAFNIYLSAVSATPLGKIIVDRLKNSKHIYVINFEARPLEGWHSMYSDPKSNGNSSLNMRALTAKAYRDLRRDGSGFQLYATIGHEIAHLWQYDVLREKNINVSDYVHENKDDIEDQASKFENYLYKAYGYDNVRTGYSERKIKNPLGIANLFNLILPKTPITNMKQKAIGGSFFGPPSNSDIPLPDQYKPGN